MKSIFFSTALLLLFFSVFAQDTSGLRRVPYALTLAVDKETTYEEQIRNTPYLYPNWSMQIYPGETIYLELELKDTKITSMKAVKEVLKPASTLTIKFVQDSEKKVHKSMMLTVHNPFPFVLEYEALMYTIKQKKFVSTSILPVQPGLAGIELWPDLITTLALGNWKFQENGAE